MELLFLGKDWVVGGSRTLHQFLGYKKAPNKSQGVGNNKSPMHMKLPLLNNHRCPCPGASFLVKKAENGQI